MKQLRVNTRSISCEDLIKIAQKCGFVVKESRKHCKIKTLAGEFVSMIPRHNQLKRETAKGIVGAFNKFGANISYV